MSVLGAVARRGGTTGQHPRGIGSRCHRCGEPAGAHRSSLIRRACCAVDSRARVDSAPWLAFAPGRFQSVVSRTCRRVEHDGHGIVLAEEPAGGQIHSGQPGRIAGDPMRGTRRRRQSLPLRSAAGRSGDPSRRDPVRPPGRRTGGSRGPRSASGTSITRDHGPARTGRPTRPGHDQGLGQRGIGVREPRLRPRPGTVGGLPAQRVEYVVQQSLGRRLGRALRSTLAAPSAAKAHARVSGDRRCAARRNPASARARPPVAGDCAAAVPRPQMARPHQSRAPVGPTSGHRNPFGCGMSVRSDGREYERQVAVMQSLHDGPGLRSRQVTTRPRAASSTQ